MIKKLFEAYENKGQFRDLCSCQVSARCCCVMMLKCFQNR